MDTPPKPKYVKTYFRSKLFSSENIFALSKQVEPSFEHARAGAMAYQLQYEFEMAFDLAFETNLKVLKGFYAKVVNDLRRAATTLGLPTDPFKIASEFPYDASRSEDKIPDGLSWLLNAGAAAVGNSKAFDSLINKSLSGGPYETREFDEEQRKSFCYANLCSLPFLLALAIGATEEALRQTEEALRLSVNRYENPSRRFLHCLFEGFVVVHFRYFGCPPQIQDSDNLPEGSGLIWTQGILKIAAENIDVALAKLESPRFRKLAIDLVKQAGHLAQATIADRLAQAKKTYALLHYDQTTASRRH